MSSDPDQLRSAVDGLVETTVRMVIDAAGSDAFDAVERAYLDRDRPADVPLGWRRGSVFSTLLLGPLVEESEGEDQPDAARDPRVRQLVDEGVVALARVVREHPEAVASIYEELYGKGAASDSSEHASRDVAICLFASFDAEG